MTDSATTHQQTKYKVLLIGDNCIDEYKIGSVDRLSPEAPVPVIKLIKEFDLPGMAANVKVNLLKLDIDVDFITNSQTILKTRYIDQRSGQHLLRVDSEPKLEPWDQETSIPISNYDAVVISDYNKGFLTYENIQYIIHSTQCPIFIDTKKSDLAKLTAAHTYLKINETEFKLTTSAPQNLIVTLGEKGAMLIQNQEKTMFPTTAVEVMDVCGCGDTFLSALTAQFLYTNNIHSAIMCANVAAGITAQHRGNYAPTYKEIENARY